MPKQRREGEANGPRGQRPPGASRAGPSWTEFVRPAHQAVVAFAGAGIINRAEPRACGHSREPIYLDSEPDTERNAGSASNAAGDGCGRARSDKAGFQPYRGKLAVRDEQRGWGKRRQDLMAVCHDARKGRNIGIHWSKPVAPPLHSTSSSPPPTSWPPSPSISRTRARRWSATTAGTATRCAAHASGGCSRRWFRTGRAFHPHRRSNSPPSDGGT